MAEGDRAALLAMVYMGYEPLVSVCAADARSESVSDEALQAMRVAVRNKRAAVSVLHRALWMIGSWPDNSLGGGRGACVDLAVLRLAVEVGHPALVEVLSDQVASSVRVLEYGWPHTDVCRRRCLPGATSS